jgi:cell division protein FtsZ
LKKIPTSSINVKIVGVGGAGGNALLRMLKGGLTNAEVIALNTDVQALKKLKEIRSFAIGPNATKGLGSGGHPDIGRKAIRESIEQIGIMLKGSDMVFIAAGMGGGTGTGASATVADIARKQGALTVGVVTLPFSFEGPRRRAIAEQGLYNLQQKVDTLITIENDRLLPSLTRNSSLESALTAADEVLRQGVQGITDIITVPGMINVDFADVKAIMSNGGPAFMAVGEGKGKWASAEAAEMAICNPLFDAPVKGASGVLFNVTGGNDLTLAQVHEVADVIRRTAKPDANVIFGVVQDKKMKKRVRITLVATGVESPVTSEEPAAVDRSSEKVAPAINDGVQKLLDSVVTNGHTLVGVGETRKLI